MNNDYKLEQLRKMLAIEQGEKGVENSGYGAHLTHWAGYDIKPINLDSHALRALIKHYEQEIEEDTQNA